MKIQGCRICGNLDLKPVLSLGDLPLANALLKASQLTQPEPTFPLDLVLCLDCSLLQITETVPPEMLFREYPYFSSFSDTMLHHAKALADELTGALKLSSESLAMEVASNDGYLLQYFKRSGIPVLGIEPARNIAAVAESKGIPTISEFFTDGLAEELSRKGIHADVLIGNNVLAHVAQLHEFVEGVRILLKPDGIAVFESAYALDTIDQCEFDQIYHEHLCYYSLTALVRLFDLHGLQIFDARILPIHGGSIRVYASIKGNKNPSDSLLKILDKEEGWGVRGLERYIEFAEKTQVKRGALLTLLHDLKSKGNRIAAYGAAAKGTILLNAFGIGTDLIDYVVDRSTYKQGNFMPGCHLPIHEPERLMKDLPDYTLMLAWNFKEEVLKQQQDYRQAGGKFIIPVPDVEII